MAYCKEFCTTRVQHDDNTNIISYHILCIQQLLLPSAARPHVCPINTIITLPACKSLTCFRRCVPGSPIFDILSLFMFTWYHLLLPHLSDDVYIHRVSQSIPDFFLLVILYALALKYGIHTAV